VERVLQCDCGFEARATDEQALVEEVRRHASEAHGMALSHEEALLLALRAELNEQTASTIARRPTARIERKEEQ
jgi:hypothetical protein